MIKMLDTVRGAHDALGLKVATYEKGKTYSSETDPPTSESLEANLVRGKLAVFVEAKPQPEPQPELEKEPEEEPKTKPEGPDKTKPESPAKAKQTKKKTNS